MSYPRDLDEFTAEELTNEMARRLRLQLLAQCDYCGRPGNSDDCKFPDRHAVARAEYGLGKAPSLKSPFLARFMRVV